MKRILIYFLFFHVSINMLNGQQTKFANLQSITDIKITNFHNLTVYPNADEKKFKTPQALMSFFLTVQDKSAFEQAYFKSNAYSNILNTYPDKRSSNAKDRSPIDLVHLFEYKAKNNEHLGVLKAYAYLNGKPAPFCYFLKKANNRWYLLFKKNLMTDPLANFILKINTERLITLLQKPKQGEHYIMNTTRSKIMTKDNQLNLSYFIHLFTYEWLRKEEKIYLEYFKDN